MINFQLLLPNKVWLPRLKRFGVRGDIIAGLTGALLAFPQAIALASLAGVPSEHGIYASIIPIVIAALWGSSWHVIGGTNTAMAMLLASAIAAMSINNPEQYITIILVMTFLAGIIQLGIGLLSLGRILDFISSTVVSTLILAVAINTFVAVLPNVVGSENGGSGSVFSRVMAFPEVFSSLSIPALIIGLSTVISALLFKVFLPRYAFVLGLSIGVATYWGATTIWTKEFSEIKMLSEVSFDLLSFNIPNLSLLPTDQNSLIHILISAVSLALLGMTQSIVIARSIAQTSGQRIDANREIAAQGMANVTSSFFSGFAVSSSFSSSATNFFAGAFSPFSAVVIAVTVTTIGLTASHLLTIIPGPVIAGGLMFIAISMFKLETLSNYLKPRHEFFIFLITLFSSLTFGLAPGILAGVVLSALVYLWSTAQPRIHVEERTASDGRPVHIITIEGSLFFGAVQEIEDILRKWTEKNGQPSTLVIRTDRISYIDVPGTRLLLEEAKRREIEGGELYLYIVRDTIYEQLKNSNLLPLIGEDKIIRPNTDHPMNAILFSNQQIENLNISTAIFSSILYPVTLKQERKNSALFKTLYSLLKTSRQSSHLDNNQIKELISGSTLFTAKQYEKITLPENTDHTILILISGQLQISILNTEEEKKVTRTINSIGRQVVLTTENTTKPEIISTTTSHYLLIDNTSMMQILGRSTVESDSKTLSILDTIPKDILKKIQDKLFCKKVKKSEILINQGDEANNFYILFEGEAQVSIHSLLDQSTHKVAKLYSGDSFGEEGLLQSTSRNAEVRMLTNGEIGILAKNDFIELLMPIMAEPIDYKNASLLVDSGTARWLDCRYKLEYETGTLQDALQIPLNLIRQRIFELERDTTYIIYCSNGMRSKAATFLLKERNINALYLEGGLSKQNKK